MENADWGKLFDHTKSLEKKMDQVLQALNGDEFNQYPGLIAEQKNDNEFRGYVKDKLETITRNQEHQKKINLEVNERLESVEVFVKFFTTLGKIKRTTWMIIGAMIAGAGLMLTNIEKMGHWVYKITH